MKKTDKKISGRGRRFRQGWYATCLTVVVVAAVIVLNVVLGAAEEKWALKLDWSPNSITSFSDKTYDTLDKLDQDVTVYLLFQKGTKNDLRVSLEEILNKYRARSAFVKLETIDPVTEPGRVNKYKDAGATNLSEGSVIVTNADESRVKVVPASEMYSYTFNQQSYSYQVTSFNGESKLTTAIQYVVSADTPKVYVLTGHDELASSYLATITTQLKNENYEVADLALGGETQPAAGDTLLAVMPVKDLTDGEYETLRDFLAGGGRLLYVSDPTVDRTHLDNWKKLLSYYALSFKDGYVIEDESSTSNYLTSPLYLVPNTDAESDITKNLSSARLVLPQSSAIGEVEMPLPGFSYTKLLTTSSKAYLKKMDSENSVLERSPMDETGSFTLAMSAMHQEEDSQKDTRIILLGCLYAVADTNYLYSTGNLDFTLNCIDWLVNRQVSTYIRSKSIASMALAIPDSATFWTLAALIVIALPGIVLIAGIWVFLRRRKL